MQALLRCRGFDLAEEHQCLLVDIQDCSLEDLPAGGCMLCCAVPCCAALLQGLVVEVRRCPPVFALQCCAALPPMFTHFRPQAGAQGVEQAQAHQHPARLLHQDEVRVCTPEADHPPTQRSICARTPGTSLSVCALQVKPPIRPCAIWAGPPARRPLPPNPDGTPRTEAALMVHLDPHIPFIPAFLLNFVLGVLAPYIFNQVGRGAALVPLLGATRPDRTCTRCPMNWDGDARSAPNACWCLYTVCTNACHVQHPPLLPRVPDTLLAAPLSAHPMTHGVKNSLHG